MGGGGVTGNTPIRLTLQNSPTISINTSPGLSECICPDSSFKVAVRGEVENNLGHVTSCLFCRSFKFTICTGQGETQ